MRKREENKVSQKVTDAVARSTDRQIIELEDELKRLKSKYEGRYDHVKKKILAYTKGKGRVKLVALSRDLEIPISEIEPAIVELHREGQEIYVEREHVLRYMIPPKGEHQSLFSRIAGAGWIKFGVLGDTQLGNRHARIDILNTAYDHYESEGIDTVYHTGNIVDGYHPEINAMELVPEAGPSFERQTEYAATVYPRKKGIKTYFITGECHEGWWVKKHGWNIGRTMEDRFRDPESCHPYHDFDPVTKRYILVKPCEHYKSGGCPVHGRNDLVYLGHLEADVEFRTPALKDNVPGPIGRILHPGGGTAYALSYKTQKISEAYQGGEKPKIQFVGHFHKYNVDYHREVYSVQTGCLEDQTSFMRKLHIQAHVGYLIAEILIGKDGITEGFKHQFFPFYDRKFYRKYTKW